MKRNSTPVCRFVVYFLVCAVILFGNGTERSKIIEMNVEETLILLRDSDWHVRYNAIVYGVNKFMNDDRIRIALITLLEDENNVSQNWWEDYKKTGGDLAYLNQKYKFGEGHGEYIIELIDKVIALNDKRAINALIYNVHLGTKPLKAVVRFGRLAVEPLIKHFDKTKNPTAKSSMIEALGLIVKESKFDSIISDASQLNVISITQRKEIKDFLIKTLNDEDPYVRQAAIGSLKNLGDADVIPMLNRIKETDPYKINEGEKGEVYPIREAAGEAIRLLIRRE